MGRNGVVAPAPGDCHVAVAPRNDGARRRAKSPNPFLCVIARSPEAARGDPGGRLAVARCTALLADTYRQKSYFHSKKRGVLRRHTFCAIC